MVSVMELLAMPTLFWHCSVSLTTKSISTEHTSLQNGAVTMECTNVDYQTDHSPCLKAWPGHCITWLTCWIPSMPGSQPLNFDVWPLSCNSFTSASPRQPSFSLASVMLLSH